uniref:ABC-type xenobiotic transporter n=1 Tax=Clastoptera arizonana TaxID=38151 RepID=A0A1B6E6B2_9HEMI
MVIQDGALDQIIWNSLMYEKVEFSTLREKLCFTIGAISAVLMGVTFPFIVIVYGELMTLMIARNTPGSIISPSLILKFFGGGKTNSGAPHNEQMDSLIDDGVAYFIATLILASITFIFGVISIWCLNYASLHKVGRIRRVFLQAILRQDLSWHDTQNTGAFATKFTDSLDKIQDGTGEKVGIFSFLVSTFVASIIVAMFYGWELTLVMTSTTPLFIIITVIVAKLQSRLTTKEAESYGEAGAVVEEVLSSIRTVSAYSGEEKELKRYEQKMEPARKVAIRSGIYTGLGGGITWLLIYCCYALCFWYGIPLILRDRDNEDKTYTPGVVLIILFGVVSGAMNLGFTSPHLEAFAKAKGASKSIYKVLQRRPAIDVNSGGIKLDKKLGEIHFKNVQFSYPARPNVEVLKSLNFKVKPGENVALVGGSGSGKSTTIQLLERFYDPTGGTIYLNGVDLKQLDLKWVRSQIGLVGQEPVLFTATIAENICCDLKVSTAQMEEAAKIANAHDFIMKLPNGYDTMVGEKGAQFSGGQKQRIAIARAIIRNPSILLLDEATSALDVKSEAIVQSALEKASKGRTTIVISHRLSSIRNVDRIIVMSEGKFIEEGTHSQLMEAKSHYYKLVSIDSDSPEKETNKSDIIISKDDKFMEDDDEIVQQVDDIKYGKVEENKASLLRILALNKPEWPYVLLGSIASFIMGCTPPIGAIIFGALYGGLSSADDSSVILNTNIYSIYFIIIGSLAALCVFLQFSSLTFAGVKLTSRLRVTVFGSMLRQEMAWFDDPKHGVGALCAKLSGDTSSIQGATGSKIGSLLQGLSTLGVGAIVSFFYSWKMTVMCLVFVPFILLSLIIEGRVMEKEGEVEKKALEDATKVAVEAITSVRTVLSLGQEDSLVKKYHAKLHIAEQALHKKLRWRGPVFAFGQTALTYSYAFSLFYGAYLIARENVPYTYIIIVSEALLFGAWMLGSILSFAPGMNLALLAAARLFKIMDRKPQIQSPIYDSLKEWKAEGDICYSDIHFAYPTRPEQKALQGLSLSIAKGQTIALVGHSGCGKSTCIQLLQRFYDPDSGTIKIDKRDTTLVPLEKLKAGMGIVSQEPTLFDRTIAENIAYGDNSRDVPMVEVIEAAQNANIHEFISSLPAGYETRLGSKGTQLSGGQKQRIAIARALVRNPKILILDEATSALDTHSQKIVQEALDAAMSGRTCIMIAHRLSTISHADVIYVLQQGRVIEMGSHSELVALGGTYAQLILQQPLS